MGKPGRKENVYFTLNKIKQRIILIHFLSNFQIIPIFSVPLKSSEAFDWNMRMQNNIQLRKFI